MKSLKSPFLCLLASLVGSLVAGHAATITWSGAGDGTNFNNSANWVGNVAPGAFDDAVITNGAGTHVVVTSGAMILSVQCSRPFSVSNAVFTVTAGPSQVIGALALAAGTGLEASGAGTTFTANGPAMADDANFYVSAGAVVALPNLGNYHKICAGASWTVTGAGSVLNLSGLTNILGDPCGYPVIQATSGGQLLATNVISIAAGPLGFQADGAGSLIDLGKLSSCAGQSPYLVTFEASAGGSILMPLMRGGPLVSITLSAGGAIPTSQLTQLYQLTLFAPSNCNALTNVTQLTVNDATNSFLSLSNF
jgi:hypothetical protein